MDLAAAHPQIDVAYRDKAADLVGQLARFDDETVSCALRRGCHSGFPHTLFFWAASRGGRTSLAPRNVVPVCSLSGLVTPGRDLWLAPARDCQGPVWAADAGGLRRRMRPRIGYNEAGGGPACAPRRAHYPGGAPGPRRAPAGA